MITKNGKEDPLSDGFGWVGGHGPGERERVPIVEFDFEAIFRREEKEPERQVPRVPLDQILSPRELQAALRIARGILKRASPRSRAKRANWRDPVIRARMIAAITSPEARRKRSESTRRTWRFKDREPLAQAARARWRDPVIRARMIAGTTSPEARRKRSESALRMWRLRDRKPNRELMLRLWRECRAELLAKMQRPEYRKKMSESLRAKWTEPAFRQKMLCRDRSPEVRLRKSVAMKRYIHEHPEVRQRRADIQRSLWRDPEFRVRQSRRVRAGIAAKRMEAKR